MSISIPNRLRGLSRDIPRRRLTISKLQALSCTQTEPRPRSKETSLSGAARSASPLTSACARISYLRYALNADGNWGTDEAGPASAGGTVANVDIAVGQVVGEVVRGESIVESCGAWGVAFLGLGGLEDLWEDGRCGD